MKQQRVHQRMGATERRSTRQGRRRRNGTDPSANTAEEILQAASRLFAERGYTGTSTAAIAEAAGLQQPSIYYYYGGKDEILRALASEAIFKPLANLEEVMSHDDPPSVQLFRAVYLHVRHDLSGPYSFTPVLEEFWRLPREEYRDLFDGARRYTRGVQSIIERGVSDGTFVERDPFTATMAILGMCNWAIRWFHTEGRLSAADVAEDFAALAVSSLIADRRKVARIKKLAGLDDD